MRNKITGNNVYKKTTVSLDANVLEALDCYAVDHFLPRAYALHLLLMEGMEQVNGKIELDANRAEELLEKGVKELEQIPVSLPVPVLTSFEEYVLTNGFNKRQKFVVLDMILTTMLAKKRYWKGE